jgi:hypothetical protein
MKYVLFMGTMNFSYHLSQMKFSSGVDSIKDAPQACRPTTLPKMVAK